MTQLTVMVIVAAFIEVYIFIGAILVIGRKIDNLQKKNDEYNKTLLDSLKKYLENMVKEDAKRMDISRQICVRYDKFAEVFDTFIKTCEGLKGHYAIVDDYFQKTIHAFEKAEDRYSDAYDQIKNNNEKLEKVLDEWSNCMNEMMIWYETHPDKKNDIYYDEVMKTRIEDYKKWKAEYEKGD